MSFLKEFASFAVAKPIMCKNDREVVGNDPLLRVSWNGRKRIEEETTHFCALHCPGTTCKIDILRVQIETTVYKHTR